MRNVRWTSVRVFSSESETLRDLIHVKRFQKRRLRGLPSYMLKDSADFMHDYPSTLFVCITCKGIFRDPRAVPIDLEQRYRTDPYPIELLNHLWKVYTTEYNNDRAWLLSHGLSRGAKILEIGSHVGAFLAFCEAQGWDATGIDIGSDVANYARMKGA